MARGYIARRLKVPIKKAIKQRASKIEGVALGWKTRRILKLKEVQNRIKQIKDFAKARKETLKESQKDMSIEEKQKVLNLIEGYEYSRQSTVYKLIKLIHQMSERSQWLTTATAELTDDILRTPRGKDQSFAIDAYGSR